MVRFDPESGGLPAMDVDEGASDGDRLVFVRPARRSCGLTLGVLGTALLIASGLTAFGRGRSEAMAVLALGGFGAVAFLGLGAVMATIRGRLIVDRGRGVLIGSWWFLGIENPTKVAFGEPLRVGWSREVHTTTDGGVSRERISFPVWLGSDVGGTARLWRVFDAAEEEDARRLTRVLGEFLGVGAPSGPGA
ncbi:hypothetical protein AB1L88_17135 [Tautonia sp. JC769]|uniref:hypothetical protein n=1 Tax=Tautonia sp. JC769 TaxID=3232135 RepID=UPI00345880DD